MRRVICGLVLLLFLSASGVNGQRHRIKSGDTLFISVWGQDALSGAVVVGPDGMISLPPPAGILQVKGLTIDEITERLTEHLGEFLKNPRVTVAVREFKGFTVHVYGQVVAPSFYKIPEDTTLQEVLAHAGGTTEYADLEHIQILHRGEEQVTPREINFQQFLLANHLNANPVIGENDSVFVPRLDEETYRQQRVTILGAVPSPGVYPLERPRSVLDVLAFANGVLPEADLSQIHLFHASEKPTFDITVDLTTYLSGTAPQGNPLVEPGQTIFVPSTRLPEEYTYLVNVIGQVKRPGSYPVTKRARLLDAIYLAGGFADKAQLDQVKLIPLGGSARSVAVVDVTVYLLGRDLNANPPLEEGDTILVPISADAMQLPSVQRVFFKSKSINIIGEVRNPGTYELAMRGGVLDVLTLAGGPTGAADLKRVTILRGAGSSQEQLSIDLAKALTEGGFEKLPPLQTNDTIFLPMRRDSFWGLFVRSVRDFSTIAAAIIIVGSRL